MVIIIVLGLGLLFPAIGPPKEHPKRAEANGEVLLATSALKAYFPEYNEPLAGSNAQIITALRGENPRKIIFFDGPPERFNSQGELVDPWGTPYRFDISDPENPRVWSCGPNRKDESGAAGSDDVVSWR